MPLNVGWCCSSSSSSWHVNKDLSNPLNKKGVLCALHVYPLLSQRTLKRERESRNIWVKVFSVLLICCVHAPTYLFRFSLSLTSQSISFAGKEWTRKIALPHPDQDRVLAGLTTSLQGLAKCYATRLNAKLGSTRIRRFNWVRLGWDRLGFIRLGLIWLG